MSISNDSLRSMLNNMINENADKAAEDLHDYLKNLIQSKLGLTEDVGFDPAASRSEAEKIAAEIKDRFSVSVELKSNKNGSVSVEPTTDVSTSSENNPYIFSLKNLSATIDGPFREFRKKGWTFTQPINGKFTIGVPSKE